jgi:hypothetical protein
MGTNIHTHRKHGYFRILQQSFFRVEKEPDIDLEVQDARHFMDPSAAVVGACKRHNAF